MNPQHPNHHIHCSLRHTPEALERVLQVIRIRGFQLGHLQMHSDGCQLRLDMGLQGQRPIDNLLKQLQKLVGMETVQALSSVQTLPQQAELLLAIA